MGSSNTRGTLLGGPHMALHLEAAGDMSTSVTSSLTLRSVPSQPGVEHTGECFFRLLRASQSAVVTATTPRPRPD
jgi:hypothetical protein